jgi:glycosyltransferase involved in cell wall biosynthesis
MSGQGEQSVKCRDHGPGHEEGDRHLSVSCVAVLCVRNEEQHIRRAIVDFVSGGIDVAVIDHGSTDGTYAIAADFLGAGVVSLDRLPWLGEYDHTRQLEAKRDLIARLDCDWVIHADADEWLHSPRSGESLLEGIQRTAELGFDVINFEEFVFLPARHVTDVPRDYPREMRRYYFFAPQPVRLMRAWDRRRQFSNIAHGGHLLEGPDLRLSPEAFVLRHYIVLSQAQAIEKYRDRVFSRQDLAKGWHGNRLDLTEEKLRLPDPAALMELATWDSRELDRSVPHATHYWEWQS